ncbi:MAG: O-antigen ligase family protein, partial [Planctomycetaceae bacterium]|nr:O-antigen ligase family protein [Planctomycetaceae bacterium]
VGALIAWCSVSLVWSISSGMTLRRLFVLYCVLLAALGTSRQLPLKQILWLTLLTNFGFLVIGFLAEVSLGTFRPWAGDHRFSGTLHPNTQGLNLAAMCFAALCLVRIRPDRRVFLWTVFGIGMVFIYLTKSRTSFLGMFVALAAIWSLSVPFLYKFSTVCVGVWFVSVVGLLFILAGTDITESASDAALMGREEQAESLTGRLPLWTELSNYADDRLLVGYGYESFWTPQHIDEVSSELGWGLREAHNSFLDAVLGIGLIGLFLALAMSGLALLQASNAAIKTKNPGYAFLVALIVFGMLNSFTESSMIMISFYTYLLATGIFHLALKPLDETDVLSTHLV